MLQFALRLGEHPQQVITTTPRNVGVLKAILLNPSTVVTHAPTEANRAYLAASFLEEVRGRYAGTRLGRQELDGVLLDDVEGALWAAGLEAARVDSVPALDRIVVAVDPAVTARASSDECGIIVAGVVSTGPAQDWRAIVLEVARRGGGRPTWARAAIAAREMGRRAAGGRGEPGRRSGRKRAPADRPAGAVQGAARCARQGGAGRAGRGALRTGPGQAPAHRPAGRLSRVSCAG